MRLKYDYSVISVIVDSRFVGRHFQLYDTSPMIPNWPWAWPCWNCTGSYKFSVSVKKTWEGWTGGASDIVKAYSSGEGPRATGGLVSNLPHPRVNKTKQHTLAGNTKNRESTCSWLMTVRLFHPWADNQPSHSCCTWRASYVAASKKKKAPLHLPNTNCRNCAGLKRSRRWRSSRAIWM